MYQGTTHILILEVEDTDLTGKTVQVSLRTLSGKLITKGNTELDIAEGQIAIHLTQEDTLALPHGPVRCQVRWVDSSGNASVSEVCSVDVEGIQTDNVIGDDDA